LGPFNHDKVADLPADSVVFKLVVMLPYDCPMVGEIIQVLAQVGIECHPAYNRGIDI